MTRPLTPPAAQRALGVALLAVSAGLGAHAAPPDVGPPGPSPTASAPLSEALSAPSNPSLDRLHLARSVTAADPDGGTGSPPVTLESVEDLPQTPPPALTLGAVLESLERTHPVLQAARAALAGAEGQLTGADGAFDTKLMAQGKVTPFGKYIYNYFDTEVVQPTTLWGTTFFGGWRRSGGELPIYYGELQTVNAGEAVVGVRVPLWQGGPIDEARAKIRRARLKLDQAQLEVVGTALKLRRTAAEAYWRWVAAGHARRIAAHLLTIAELRVAQLEARVANGDLPAIDLVENQRAILGRQADVIRAARAQEEAALKLSLHLRDAEGLPRVPEPEAVPLHFPDPEPLPVTTVAADLAHALANRPEVMKLSRDVEAAGVDLELAENQAAPQIDLSVAGVQPFGPPPVEGGLASGKTELEAGVKFSLPLQRRKAEGAAVEARAARLRARLQRQYAEDTVRAEVADARSALKAARQRVAVAEAELTVARQVEAAETIRLEAGDSTLLILNLREQSTADAARRLVDALADHHIADAAWRAATAWALDLAPPGAPPPEGGDASGAPPPEGGATP